jgi:hypothetical protein
MKKLLILPLLFLLAFTGCKKDGDGPADTRLALTIFKQEQSSTGDITEIPASAIVHVWKAEGRDFDVAASGTDINIGYAYDKTTQTSYTANHGAVGNTMREKIEPGRYFVYVVLPKSANAGSQAYSHTYFDIKEGQTKTLKKVFSYNVANNQFENWAKNN